jgi:hypothetical protein
MDPISTSLRSKRPPRGVLAVAASLFLCAPLWPPALSESAMCARQQRQADRGGVVGDHPRHWLERCTVARSTPTPPPTSTAAPHGQTAATARNIVMERPEFGVQIGSPTGEPTSVPGTKI